MGDSVTRISLLVLVLTIAYLSIPDTAYSYPDSLTKARKRHSEAESESGGQHA